MEVCVLRQPGEKLLAMPVILRSRACMRGPLCSEAGLEAGMCGACMAFLLAHPHKHSRCQTEGACKVFAGLAPAKAFVEFHTNASPMLAGSGRRGGLKPTAATAGSLPRQVRVGSAGTDFFLVSRRRAARLPLYIGAATLKTCSRKLDANHKAKACVSRNWAPF